MEDEVIYRTKRHPYTAPGIKDINDVVSEVFGIERKDLFTRTRKRDIVDARAVAMWWMRKNKNISLHGISSRYSLDHATTIHNVRKIDSLIEVDREMKRKVGLVVEMAAPMAGNPREKKVTLKERDLKRMLYRHYIRGSREAFWVHGTYDELPSIGKYRRLKAFLIGLKLED